MRTGLSVPVRAAVAVALYAGYYVFSLGIAAALLFVPYARWVYLDRPPGWISAFCLVGGALILWTILPRVDRFVPPGPRLLPADHPRLFEAIADVAHATNQRMPAEVFLVPGVEAWVGERGGLMGLGSRRVMGVGLGCLEVLTIPQFHAVLAHEFGHYHTGDTKLGPWIYTTRSNIGRTVEVLEKHIALLAAPFKWYGMMFLRITHAVSRRQEYAADALAAHVAGPEAVAGALRAIAASAPAFNAYWATEAAPVLERGYRPPIADGFRRFLEAPPVVEQMAEHIAESLAGGVPPDPYDTHPTLRERLAALEELPDRSRARDTFVVGDTSPRARALLGDVARVESELVASMVPPGEPTPAPISWEAMPRQLMLPMWREGAERHAEKLAALTPAGLAPIAARLAKDPQALMSALGIQRTIGVTIEECMEEAAYAVACALAVALTRRADDPASGLTLSASPGEPVTFRCLRDGVTHLIEPSAVVARLAEGTLTAEAWLADCRAAGIDGVPLGNPVPVAAGV